MEWVGLIALALILCYSSYPGKVNRLEHKVKQLERKQKGEPPMSKMIMDLVGHRCKLYTDEALSMVGNTSIDCQILDADEEWIKFSYADKKSGEKTAILRIEVLDSVEVLDQVRKETINSQEITE